MSLTGDTRRVRVQRFFPIRVPTLETAREWRCECGAWLQERDNYCGYCGSRTAPKWLDSRPRICPNCRMDESVHERYGMCPVFVVAPNTPDRRFGGKE